MLPYLNHVSTEAAQWQSIIVSSSSSDSLLTFMKLFPKVCKEELAPSQLQDALNRRAIRLARIIQKELVID